MFSDLFSGEVVDFHFILVLVGDGVDGGGMDGGVAGVIPDGFFVVFHFGVFHWEKKYYGN